MANMRSTPLRLTAGSIITIQPTGGIADTLKVLEPGTWRWTPGWYDAVEYTDRGVLQSPLRGDQRPGELAFSCKYTGSTNALDLQKILLVTGATGLVMLFSVVLKIPDYNGAATGEQGTFASCFLRKAPTIKDGGKECDMIDVEFAHNEVSPTFVTY